MRPVRKIANVAVATVASVPFVSVSSKTVHVLPIPIVVPVDAAMESVPLLNKERRAMSMRIASRKPVSVGSVPVVSALSTAVPAIVSAAVETVELTTSARVG